MPKRETYSDIFTGANDKGLERILGGDDDEEEGEDSSGNKEKMKKIMIKVINNELTPRQKQMIMLYYFKGIDIVKIGKMLDVTPQAVSAVLKRARLRIHRYMKYYI